jgi:hypothetical protein
MRYVNVPCTLAPLPSSSSLVGAACCPDRAAVRFLVSISPAGIPFSGHNRLSLSSQKKKEVTDQFLQACRHFCRLLRRNLETVSLVQPADMKNGTHLSSEFAPFVCKNDPTCSSVCSQRITPGSEFTFFLMAPPPSATLCSS